MVISTQYTLAGVKAGKASLVNGHSFIVFGFQPARNGQGKTGEQFKTFLEISNEESIMNDETFLNEPVQVVAIFKPGHHPCMPVRFKRANGREVQVSELGLRHPLPHGLKTMHAFDVTDGGTDYRLEFDSERLTWRLTMEADHYE